MASNQIEKLIAASKWKSAQSAIEKRLVKERDNHWLWSRLSAVKYEQRDYEGALADAAKALEIVPDCPLALWDYAGALDMLGRTPEAAKVYFQLLRRGLEELKTPDDDAKECWEGKDWTVGLMTDCSFRIAGLLAKNGERNRAVELYKDFLDLLDHGAASIYTREDAMVRLDKLQKAYAAIPRTAVRKTLKALSGLMAERTLEKLKA
jgi:tetratricopeptide (TPR) repeat protein